MVSGYAVEHLMNGLFAAKRAGRFARPFDRTELKGSTSVLHRFRDSQGIRHKVRGEESDAATRIESSWRKGAVEGHGRT